MGITATVVFHKKKMVDYRKLNSITKMDSFPQTTTEQVLYRLYNHRFYSKLDLKSEYLQTLIHTDQKDTTAFITQDSL